MYGPWPQSWSPYCIDISIVSPDQFCSTPLCQNLLEQKLNKSSWVKSCLVPSTSSLPIFSKHSWLINFLFEDQLLYFCFDKFVFVKQIPKYLTLFKQENWQKLVINNILHTYLFHFDLVTRYLFHYSYLS